MAYEQLYSLYGANCYNCDTDRAMESVYIDDVPMRDLVANVTSAGDNFIEIEPITGVMARMRRTYTVVLSLYCYDHSKVGEWSETIIKPLILSLI